MDKDPKYPHRKIIEVYNPPIRIMRTDRDTKAISYYKFRGAVGKLYYQIDIYEENGKPYEYKDGNWSASDCVLVEAPKSNRDAISFLQKEE